jgi:hypothetical protein
MRPRSASHSTNGGVGGADGAAGLETAVRALAARRRRIIGAGDSHQPSERQFSGPTARSWDAIRQRIPLDPSAALVDSFGSNAAGTDLHSSASAAHLDSKDRVSSTTGGPQQARRLAQLHSQLEQVKVWAAAREQELIDQVRDLETKLKGVSEVNRNLAIEVIRQRRGIEQEPSANGATRTTPGQQGVGATSLAFLEATEATERWKGRCLAAEAVARIVQQRCAAAESQWSRSSSTRGNSPPIAAPGTRGVHQRTQLRESPRKRPGTAGAGSGGEKQPTHFADVADASPVDVLRALERAMVTETSTKNHAPRGAWSPLLSDTDDAEPHADDGELHWTAPVERACPEPPADLKGFGAVSHDRSLRTSSAHSAAPLASMHDEPRGRGPTGRQRLAEAVQRMRYYSRSGSSRPGDHSVL